jgi:ribose/xylose/arabinose/galactoside ABC-type transport system permease subunit
MNDLALQHRPSVGARLSKFTKDYAIVVAILLLMIIFTLTSPYFLTYNNIRNILMQTVPIAVVCIGQALIVTTGEFDLSLGQNVCLTSCVMAYLIKFAGFNPWIAILCAILVGTAVGASNGVLIAYARIPCFIVTLGFQMIAKGLAKIITNASPIPDMPQEILFIGRDFIGGKAYGVPVSVVILLVLYIVFIFLSQRTKFGRSLYAMGGSQEAAYFAGIDVKMYRMLVYTIAGALCGVSSVILVTRLNSASLTNGSLYEFDAMISCILGGISLAGGRGKVVQALFGAIFLMLFFNGMTMLNVNPFVQDVLKGVVMISAVALDVIRNKTK